MLHENPFMIDIDVDHWRAMQALLLDSAKAKRRIIVIHEQGEILKFVHSDRIAIVRNLARIAQPLADAEAIYRQNAQVTDFVVVLERRSVERFFAEIQDSWSADEDLDQYVHRMFAKLDAYGDGIAVFPGPARTQLGLQWRLGASYDEVIAAVTSLVAPKTTAVFGVFAAESLSASLVLGFDENRRVTLITTADPSKVQLSGNMGAVAKDLARWVAERHAACSLGLFMDFEGAKAFLARRDKLNVLRELRAEGRLVAEPLPQALAQALAG